MSPAGFGMTTAGPLYSFGDVIRKEFVNLTLCYVILNRERNSSYLLNNCCHLRINMKLQPVILQLTNPTKHPRKLSFSQFSVTGRGVLFTCRNPKSTAVEYPQNQGFFFTTMNYEEPLTLPIEATEVNCPFTSNFWPP